MRYRLLLVLALLLTTACDKQDETAVKPAVDPGPPPAEVAAAKQKAEEEAAAAEALAAAELAKKAEAEQQEAAEAAAKEAEAKRLAAASTKLDSLNEELASLTAAYRKKLGQVKTREERTELVKNSPMNEVGPKFIEFAKEFAGTEEARSALMLMTSRGQGDSKLNAMKMLLAIVDADPDHEEADSVLKLIVTRGMGKPKSTAMARMLATAESDPDSDESFEILSLLAFDRGNDESKTKALEKIHAMIESSPGSDRAAASLAKIATLGSEDEKAKAIKTLIEDYVNHDSLVAYVSSLSRAMPNPENEKRVNRIIEATENPKVKGNALITKVGLINRIDMYKGVIDGMSETQLKSMGDETVEYIKADRDDDEMDNIQALMEEFIKNHPGVVEKLERELFALKNLRIDCEVPEISGLDLDGSPFKLSDYRGKVVLIDFWGDW